VPISGERRREILHAAMVVLADRGYDKVAFDAVSELAHVSKPTLYRHWGSRFELLMDALRQRSAEQHVADRGSLREDLLALVLDENSIFTPVPFAAFCGMFAEVVRDRDAAEVFMRTFVEEQPDVAAVWDRARQRGEVGVDVDSGLFTTALFFGLVHVTLLEGQPIAPASVARVIDSVVLPGATSGICNTSRA
jgi:AcrR family transcriptional regulator